MSFLGSILAISFSWDLVEVGKCELLVIVAIPTVPECN